MRFSAAFLINPHVSAIPILAVSMLLLASIDSPTPTPPSAEQLLAKAKTKAAAEHKTISWLKSQKR